MGVVLKIQSASDSIFVTAATPGQSGAAKWLSENPEGSFRAPEPGDLDRLTQSHENDPRDREFGAPTVGHGDDLMTPRQPVSEEQLRDQISRYLPEGTGVDREGVFRDVKSRHGLIDLSGLSDRDYWGIVRDNHSTHY